MDYRWHYDELIRTRKERVFDSSVYTENHHVVLKSMGGTEDESNKVRLTAREHFLAHWLLWRIHRNRQTAYAFATFCNFFQGRNHRNRPKITSGRGYKEAREAYSRIHKERLTGVTNSNRSKKVLQYDLEGNFIKEWPSAKEVYRELNICHVTACCRGERKWAGEFIWKYENPELKKSKKYKKRTFTKKRETSLSKENIRRISKATSGRKWYNDGKRDFFLKPFDSIDGLTLGRLATRTKI